MQAFIARVDLSLRRSRVRVRILYALEDLHVATVARIADHVHSDDRHVRAALRGAPPGFKREHSLLRLGLVRERSTAIGFVFELTDAGREAVVALRDAQVDGR